MSTGDIAYPEQLPAPRSHRPAYGEVESPKASAEPEKETTARPLDRGTEAILAVAIVTPVTTAYGAIAYGLYLAAAAIF